MTEIPPARDSPGRRPGISPLLKGKGGGTAQSGRNDGAVIFTFKDMDAGPQAGAGSSGGQARGHLAGIVHHAVAFEQFAALRRRTGRRHLLQAAGGDEKAEAGFFLGCAATGEKDFFLCEDGAVVPPDGGAGGDVGLEDIGSGE